MCSMLSAGDTMGNQTDVEGRKGSRKKQGLWNSQFSSGSNPGSTIY